MAGEFLLLGLAYAAMALLWADDRLIHAVFAALWVIVAVGYFVGRWTVGWRALFLRGAGRLFGQ